jgi:hypothetical protein
VHAYSTGWYQECKLNSYRGVLNYNTVQTLQQGSRMILFCASRSRVKRRQLAMSLYKLKASVTYLNWIKHLRATVCLHFPLAGRLTSKAQNGNQSCSWCKCYVNTDGHATVASTYTTGQDLTWSLFLYADIVQPKFSGDPFPYLRPLQVVVLFLVHRPHPFLESWNLAIIIVFV